MAIDKGLVFISCGQYRPEEIKLDPAQISRGKTLFANNLSSGRMIWD
jgi:hypothetical protein